MSQTRSLVEESLKKNIFTEDEKTLLEDFVETVENNESALASRVSWMSEYFKDVVGYQEKISEYKIKIYSILGRKK